MFLSFNCRLCGPKQGTMDGRPNGFPLQRNWEGLNMLDVILNKDRLV